jgi:bifunctional NMN adenylyltransferase/nudix hydrolase
MTQPSSTALIIGRWQIFHKGHECLLQAALAAAQQVIVVIGSAYRARDARNPFSWQERQAMVQATLSAADMHRVKFLPVRDYYDDDRWNAAVQSGVTQLTSSVENTILVGYKKDATSYYLDHFPGWTYQAIAQVHDIDATSLRNMYFESEHTEECYAGMSKYVSTPVIDYLQAWVHSPIYTQRAHEHRAVVQYRKRWTGDVYLTADAVVLVNQHVLLVQRGGDVGRGQWALPGGFVDKNERFYHAALRELEEETRLKLPASMMRQAYKAEQVFDHPLRSARGRLITVAYFFDLGAIPLPQVKGADDAMEAQWIPLAQLPQLEDQLFEDHAAILDKFVGLYV